MLGVVKVAQDTRLIVPSILLGQTILTKCDGDRIETSHSSKHISCTILIFLSLKVNTDEFLNCSAF